MNILSVYFSNYLANLHFVSENGTLVYVELQLRFLQVLQISLKIFLDVTYYSFKFVALFTTLLD